MLLPSTGDLGRKVSRDFEGRFQVFQLFLFFVLYPCSTSSQCEVLVSPEQLTRLITAEIDCGGRSDLRQFSRALPRWPPSRLPRDRSVVPHFRSAFSGARPSGFELVSTSVYSRAAVSAVVLY